MGEGPGIALEPHGGTDGGAEPRWDFSTNANPLGPCPAVLEAVRAADLTRYPDPAYTAVRVALAGWHGVDPDCVAVGAGASEVILRLVRASPGRVLVLAPTFSEYARCARAEGRDVIEARNPDEFLARQREAGIGFLCTPNNPTGECWPAGFLAEAASGGRLVVDLAYAPLSSAGEAAVPGGVLLHAPNKAFGVTGLRAAYALTPAPWPELAWRAPAWVIGTAEAAFLQAITRKAAQDWLAACRPVIAAWRGALADGLRALGLAVRESPATFLLAEVGDAALVAAALRAQGLRVRDASSFGLASALRLRAAPPEWRGELLAALARVVGR